MKRADKKNVNEPFKPQDTPQPPQVMDPNTRDERKDPDASASEQPRNARQDSKTDEKEKVKDSGRRLGESPLEIDDETTI